MAPSAFDSPAAAVVALEAAELLRPNPPRPEDAAGAAVLAGSVTTRSAIRRSKRAFMESPVFRATSSPDSVPLTFVTGVFGAGRRQREMRSRSPRIVTT